MTIKRYFLDVPDFSGATLEDIVEELKDYFVATEEDIHCFEKVNNEVRDCAKNIDDVKLIGSYIKYWMGLLEDFQTDFKRLLDEIPEGVEERHIETLSRFFDRCSIEQTHKCNEFENEVLERPSENDRLNSLADQVFELASQCFNDNSILKDISNRLRAFVGSRTDKRAKAKGFICLDVPQGLSWGDVSIRFLDEESVEIRAGGKPLGAKRFSVLGFENKKTKRPNTLWITLLALGRKDGELSWNTKDHSGGITFEEKKNISLLRKRLNNLFEIFDDPFYPYEKEKAYKAKFAISASKEDF